MGHITFPHDFLLLMCHFFASASVEVEVSPFRNIAGSLNQFLPV